MKIFNFPIYKINFIAKLGCTDVPSAFFESGRDVRAPSKCVLCVSVLKKILATFLP